jgi:hypothetical protein
MDAHQRRRPGQVSHAERHGLFDAVAGNAFETEDTEQAELGWKIGFGDFPKLNRGDIIHAID